MVNANGTLPRSGPPLFHYSRNGTLMRGGHNYLSTTSAIRKAVFLLTISTFNYITSVLATFVPRDFIETLTL